MTDKTISVYWFFILFIIASAMAFIVYSLYGKPLDVRGVEGVFLAEKLADCVSQGGRIPLNVLDGKGEFVITNENLLQICNLNFEVEKFKDSWNNDQLYVFLNFSTPGEKPYSVSAGNENLKINSNVNFIDSNTKNMPFCVERIMFSNGQTDNKYYSIKLFTCVNKKDKNV